MVKEIEIDGRWYRINTETGEKIELAADYVERKYAPIVCKKCGLRLAFEGQAHGLPICEGGWSGEGYDYLDDDVRHFTGHTMGSSWIAKPDLEKIIRDANRRSWIVLILSSIIIGTIIGIIIS